MNIDDLKREAAEKAVQLVQSGMVVGLGTGSTAIHATRAIGRLLQEGSLTDIVAIPTSEKTAVAAKSLNIPLTTLDQHPNIDITIDGADEIAPSLDLIKGLGGALLREKIVAAATTHFVIVADSSKSVTQLGEKAPVPVEVVPFAQKPVADYLKILGTRVELRQTEGKPFKTDENNIILDCYFDGGIDNPAAFAHAMTKKPGIVEHGLFLGMAAKAFVASPSGVEVVTLQE